MKLPQEIEHHILEMLSMPQLNKNHVASYVQKLNDIRRQMYILSQDYAQLKSTEEKYADTYFAYNFPMNVMKVMVVAKELQHSYPLLSSRNVELHILDVGCGDGTGMLGLYYGFKDSIPISLTGIDASSLTVKRAKKLMDWLTSRDSLVNLRLAKRKISPNLFKKTTQHYEIILFANSLAEIFENDEIPHTFIEQVIRCTTRDGIVIIIEPALKKFSRRLMNLRSEIIENKNNYVLLPCLHTSTCALLDIRKQREWCHQSILWKPPDFMEIINKGLNREIDYLKFFISCYCSERL